MQPQAIKLRSCILRSLTLTGGRVWWSLLISGKSHDKDPSQHEYTFAGENLLSDAKTPEVFANKTARFRDEFTGLDIDLTSSTTSTQ